MKLIKSKKLYYKRGNSDKVYNIYLYEVLDYNYDEDDDEVEMDEYLNFRIYVEYGRREYKLKRELKKDFYNKERALDAFDRLCQSKLKKGYINEFAMKKIERKKKLKKELNDINLVNL